MFAKLTLILTSCMLFLLSACTAPHQPSNTSATQINAVTHIYLAADSTVADHTLNDDYWEKRHLVTGWGQKFQPFVSQTYFMNIATGAFLAYPAGLIDNTHFQSAGAEVVAQLVFEAMQRLSH